MTREGLATREVFPAGIEDSVGRLALAVPNQNIRERQLHYDLTTFFAEQVDGNMLTEFELKFNGRDLIGEEGGSMDQITSNSLKEAEKITNINRDFEYEVRRRRHEREEFEELIKMAQGIGPNTMIVVSDFPPELMNAKKDAGGYNVKRKQTMLRILSTKPGGDIQMVSINLDQSNRQANEKIYEYFGIQPNEGELLGQRIRVNLEPDEQKALPDKLRQKYDDSLSEQFGGEWYGGRRPVDYRNTYNCVLRQTDLINECIRLDNLGWLNESYMYKVCAEMQKRFDKYKEGDEAIMPALTESDIAFLHQRIDMAGAQAAEAGIVFSGCGMSLSSAGSIGSLKTGLKLAGYGNQAFAEDGDCEFTSVSCPECGADNVHTTVRRSGAGRHVSGSCGCSKYYPD